MRTTLVLIVTHGSGKCGTHVSGILRSHVRDATGMMLMRTGMPVAGGRLMAIAAAAMGRVGGRMTPAVQVMVAVFAAVAPLSARGQMEEPKPPPLPFAVGERLNYRVRVSVAGTVGRGSMWIEGPERIRGNETWHLRSDFEAKVGWIRAFGRSESWLDPVRMTALRYQKHEAQPLSTARHTVDIFPDEHRWLGSDGVAGVNNTCDPLDELSYIYYIRTLPLGADTQFTSSRHYDVARNPVTIRVLRRERVTTPAGTFATVVVEMRVRDSQRYKREGIITLYLTDDERRIPVRIESPAPVFGTAVFTLESHER